MDVLCRETQAYTGSVSNTAFTLSLWTWQNPPSSKGCFLCLWVSSDATLNDSSNAGFLGEQDNFKKFQRVVNSLQMIVLNHERHRVDGSWHLEVGQIICRKHKTTSRHPAIMRWLFGALSEGIEKDRSTALINKPALIIRDISSIDAVDASIVYRAQRLMKHIQCKMKKKVGRNVISSVLYQTSTFTSCKKKRVLVRWILNEPPLHLRQGPRGTAAGGLWAWDEREHVRLLTQSVLTEVTPLWDQRCRVAQLGAESFHQLVRRSLFVSSMRSCQKLTSNTAAKCLTAVCSSYSTTFGRQRHWRAKTKLALHSLPTVSVSEQGCHSACRDCSVTCWLSVLVTALLFVFGTADILNCDDYF